VIFNGGRVLIEPVLECLKVTVTFVVEAFLVVLGVESESGVATDLESSDFVSGSVELGNHEVGIVSESFTEFLPDGGKRFAVAAPGSVVLDKNVLGGVHNDLFEGGANEDGNGALGFGNGLALQMGSEAARLELINVVLDAVNGEGGKRAGVDELHHFLAGAEEAESGGGGGINTDEFSETLLDTIVSA
jgi:hypothetical protein